MSIEYVYQALTLDVYCLILFFPAASRSIGPVIFCIYKQGHSVRKVICIYSRNSNLDLSRAPTLNYHTVLPEGEI